MKIGKLPTEELQSLVLDLLPRNNEHILLYPGVGEDCGAVMFGEQICVASTDPITATESEIGKLAVHVNCNDIASSGATPIAILTTILLPAGSTEQTLKNITQQIADTASELGVAVIGGHTEITEAVNKPVVSATALGKTTADKLVTTSGAKPNEMLVMTKNVALEGTAILAYEYEEELKAVLTDEEIAHAKGMMDKLSVVKEGVLAAKHHVSAMHDVTEGGIIGALWEMCEAANVGCLLYEEQLPIDDVTKKIADYFNINPLKLMSSGVMLMSIDREYVKEFIRELQSEGIEVNTIGMITDGVGRYLIRDGEDEYLSAVEADELYKVCK